MTREDVATFAAELTLTAELFGAPLSDARITAYFQALEDLAWDDLQPALAAARQCERWFPTPAVLRELIDEPLEVRAAEAFKNVWRAVAGRTGRGLSDSALAVVEAMGGWGTFKEAKVATGAILSAQFRKLYIAYAKQERVEDAKVRAIDATRPALPETERTEAVWTR